MEAALKTNHLTARGLTGESTEVDWRRPGRVARCYVGGARTRMARGKSVRIAMAGMVPYPGTELANGEAGPSRPVTRPSGPNGACRREQPHRARSREREDEPRSMRRGSQPRGRVAREKRCATRGGAPRSQRHPSGPPSSPCSPRPQAAASLGARRDSDGTGRPGRGRPKRSSPAQPRRRSRAARLNARPLPGPACAVRHAARQAPGASPGSPGPRPSRALS